MPYAVLRGNLSELLYVSLSSIFRVANDIPYSMKEFLASTVKLFTNLNNRRDRSNDFSLVETNCRISTNEMWYNYFLDCTERCLRVGAPWFPNYIS